MSSPRAFKAYSYLSVRSDGSHLKLSVRVPSEGGKQSQKAVLSCANALGLPSTEEWQAEDSEVVHDLSYDQASHSIKPSLMEVRQALQSMLKATRLPEVKGHLKMLSKMVEATIYTWCIQAGSIADHSAAKTEGSTAAEKHLFHTQKFRAAALLLDAFTVFSGMYNDLHAAQKDWGISRVDSERALVELGIRVSQLRQQTRQEWDTLTSLGAKPRYLTRLPTETVLKLRREMLALRGDDAELAAKTMLEEALASAERDQTYLNSACVRQAIPMNESQDATSADRDDDDRDDDDRSGERPSKLEDASFVLIQIDNDRKLHIDDSQLRGAEKKNAHSLSSKTKLPLSSAIPEANVTLATDHDNLGFHAYLDAWKSLESSARMAVSFSPGSTTCGAYEMALLCRIGYNTATKTIAQVRGRLGEDHVESEATNEATDLLDKIIVKRRKQLLVESITPCKDMVDLTSKAVYDLKAIRFPPCHPVDDKLIQATKKDLTLLTAQIKQIAAAGGVSLDDLERLSTQNLSDIATLTSRLAHNKSQAWEKLLSLSAAPETIQDALDRFKKRKPKPRHKPKKKALPSTVPGIDTDNATEGESHAPRVDDIQASVDRPDTGMQDTTPVGLPDEMHLDSDSGSPDGSEVERESSVTSESVAYDANDSLLCGERANGTPCTEPKPIGRERPLSLAHIPVAIPALPILFKEQYPDTCRGRFPTGTEPRFFQCQSVLFPSNSVGRLRRAASVAELGTQEETSILQDDHSHNDSEDDTWEDPYDHVPPTEEEQQWVDSIADRELDLPLVFDTLTGWQLVGELSGASASKKLLAEVKKRRAGEQT